jgi:hypothetical protein
VTAAADGRLRFGANTVIRVIAAHSESRDPTLLGQVRDRLERRLGQGPALQAALDSLPEEVTASDGGARHGNGFQAQVDYASRRWSMGIGFEDLGRHFETALGYSPRTDIAMLAGKIEHIYRSTGFFQEVRSRVRFEDGYAHDADRFLSIGRHTDFLVAPSVDIRIPGQTDLSVGYTRAFTRFDDIDFGGLDRMFFFASTQALPGVGVDFFTRAGEDVIYDDQVDAGPALPDFFVTATLSAALRPAAAIRFEASTALGEVWRRTAASERESRYGTSAIPRITAVLQLTPHLGLRAIGEYRYERFYARTGDLARKRDTISAELLATFLIHPGQSLQVVWNQSGRGDLVSPLRAYQRGGIVKLSWVWRL